jgi:hypothetical protein
MFFSTKENFQENEARIKTEQASRMQQELNIVSENIEKKEKIESRVGSVVMAGRTHFPK